MESLKPIFILGPTGSGKSALAVRLAELLGDAEIVSADAYQVYRGMEILTAAPTAEELRRTHVWDEAFCERALDSLAKDSG